ncbi:MAG TPA: patatin-like phospholipase family protein [Candidatus Obscuribacterales bacterium]
MNDKHTHTQTASPLEPFVSILSGPGGTRVILASSIMYALFDWAGLRVDRVAGVSGGAPGAALYAHGIRGKELVKLALDLDFGSMVSYHLSAAELIAAVRHGWRQWRAGKLPHTAVLSTVPLGQTIKGYTQGAWPSRFWTVAITQEGRLILTADGIWEVTWSGCVRQLSDQPAPLDVAIAATTSIPGIMHGVPLKLGDRELMLFDGGISADWPSLDSHRDCSADIAFALCGRHRLFVFDVGPDLSRMGRIIAGLRHKFVSTPPIPSTPDWVLKDDLVTVIDCPVGDVHTLKLGPSRDFKWTIIMKGFDATVAALQQAGLLKPDKVLAARKIRERYEEIASRLREVQTRAPKLCGKKSRRLAEVDGALSAELETLMRDHDLYPA